MATDHLLDFETELRAAARRLALALAPIPLIALTALL
jgi:hypothetical protein